MDDVETDIDKIAQTLLEILKSSDLDVTTLRMVRNSASEKLMMDLSFPFRKLFVRSLVDLYLVELHAKQQAAAKEKKAEESEEKLHRAGGGSDKEYDAGGDLTEYDDGREITACRSSDKRRVKVNKYEGKTAVATREYYMKHGKEKPSRKE